MLNQTYVFQHGETDNFNIYLCYLKFYNITRGNPLNMLHANPSLTRSAALYFIPFSTPPLTATPSPWLHLKHCLEKGPLVVENGKIP